MVGHINVRTNVPLSIRWWFWGQATQLLHEKRTVKYEQVLLLPPSGFSAVTSVSSGIFM